MAGVGQTMPVQPISLNGSAGQATAAKEGVASYMRLLRAISEMAQRAVPALGAELRQGLRPVLKSLNNPSGLAALEESHRTG